MLRMIPTISYWLVLLTCVSISPLASGQAPPLPAPAGSPSVSLSTRTSDLSTWWKGNLHTHSLWSDGDDFPEMVVEGYKKAGYNFLVLSDHNITQEGEKWVTLGTNKTSAIALQKYIDRFPAVANELRSREGKEMVRLKTFKEFRPLLEEHDRFLLMMGEEISAKAGKVPVHLGAVNIQKHIPPQDGASVLEVMQKNIDAVLAQRKATGKRLFPHINHPNFGWAITAEDLMQVRGDRFFEIYNGHPSVRNEGDSTHVSVERMWDITLAFRLATLHLPVLYGLAVDDAHNYHRTNTTEANAFRGWVMVRALRLRRDEIATALENGDFYASTGVRLHDIAAGKDTFSLKIDGDPRVEYTTQFIGTRRRFDQSSQEVQRTNSVPVTRKYSSEIGEIFVEAKGVDPSYQFRGDELYVRAKVISSKSKVNGYATNEVEVAWTQPIVPKR
jgi:hypothetical protein